MDNDRVRAIVAEVLAEQGEPPAETDAQREAADVVGRMYPAPTPGHGSSDHGPHEGDAAAVVARVNAHRR